MITFAVVPGICDGCARSGDVIRYRFAPASQPDRAVVTICPECVEDFSLGIVASLRIAHQERARSRPVRRGHG